MKSFMCKGKGCFMVGALAVAVFALQVQAAPQVKTYSKLNNIEQSEQGVIPVVRHSAGNIATASAAKATVYGNPIDNGYFVPMQAVKADAPGVFTADDMALGNGFLAGGTVFGYDLRVLNNGTVNGPVDLHVSLWDGDPLALVNTTAGFTNAPIVGTESDYIVGGAGLITAHSLSASFAKVAVARPSGVWMVIETTGACRLGWRLSQAPAAIGFSDDFFEFRENEDSLGTCCQNANACVAQTDCGSAARELCVDDSAEFSGLFFFGGCGITNDNCANYNGNIYGPAKTVIELLPRENRGPAGTYVGNEVILTDPVAQNRVYTEVMVSGWSTTPCVGPGVPGFPCAGGGPERLKNLSATIDSLGYASGDGAALTNAALFCDSATFDDAACQVARFGGFGGQAACNTTDFGPGGTNTGGTELDNCNPGWQDVESTVGSDWVHRCCGPVNAVDISTPDIRGGSVVNSGLPPIWDGLRNNLFELMLDVPAGARGSYTIGFIASPVTFALDQNNNNLPLLGLTPGVITIQTGQCCYNIGPTSTLCSDGLLASECLLKPPPRAFFAGADCTSDCPSCQANADCADTDCCTVDTCDVATGVCSNTAVTLTGSNDCCDPDSAGCNDVTGTGAQCAFGSNVCLDYSCSDSAGLGTCEDDPNTAACDDGDDCNYGDICAGGSCSGSDPTALICVDDADCATLTGEANFICKDDFCFCPVTPDIFIIKVPDVLDNNCYGDGDKIAMRVTRSVSGDPIAGAQVALQYDPACLKFNGIAPGQSCDAASMMELELFESVDEAAGTIFYAVGVGITKVPTGGAETIACLSFLKINDTCADCDICFTNVNPRHTYLSSDQGQPVQVIPHCSKDINAGDDITLTIPDNQNANSGCASPTANFSWAAPTASASCGEVSLECDGSLTGGEYPQGTSTICCTATSVDCGNFIRDCWTVTVSDQMTLDITIQLSPIIKGDGITRCIKFEQYRDSIQDPEVLERNIVFGGLFDYIGHYTDTIKKDKGQFECVTARDQLHTLRSCYVVQPGDCAGNGVLSVTFKGDPAIGDDTYGQWLVGGNLDGWKKDNPNASHNVIDILDFGQYVSHYGEIGLNPNTSCGYTGGNADINGDGKVDALDFAFISMNFLAESKDCCYVGDHLPSAAPVALTEVSVRDLRAMGMGELAVADVNGDGMLNMEDMALFMQGNVGTTKPVRKGDIRSIGGTK